MAEQARTDIGFEGGQVLSLRVADDAYEKLVAALEDESGPDWHQLDTDEERIRLDLSEVVYVRREAGNRTVGF